MVPIWVRCSSTIRVIVVRLIRAATRKNIIGKNLSDVFQSLCVITKIRIFWKVIAVRDDPLRCFNIIHLFLGILDLLLGFRNFVIGFFFAVLIFFLSIGKLLFGVLQVFFGVF